MTNKQYDNLRKIIIDANPDIECRNTSVKVPKPFSGLINHYDNTIRLADVLIALNKKIKNCVCYAVNDWGVFLKAEKDKEGYNFIVNNNDERIMWNLENNFDKQSDETKQFLWGILK